MPRLEIPADRADDFARLTGQARAQRKNGKREQELLAEVTELRGRIAQVEEELRSVRRENSQIDPTVTQRLGEFITEVLGDEGTDSAAATGGGSVGTGAGELPAGTDTGKQRIAAATGG